jgi:hypothetical protein
MVARVADDRARSGDISLWVPPKSLHDPLIASKTEGEIFDTISYGRNKMMGYAARIVPEDRWAIILYVRALEKNQEGKSPPQPASPPAEPKAPEKK